MSLSVSSRLRPRQLAAAATLALAGCVTTGISNPGVATDATAAPAAADVFAQQGYHPQDVQTMAAIVAGDIPQSPHIQKLGGATAHIVVDAQHVRIQGADVLLDRTAFALALRDALTAHSPHSVRYVDSREAPEGSSRVQAGPQRGRGGSGGGHRGSGANATFIMEIDVSALPAQTERVGAQRYALRILAAGNRQAVWQGTYDLDAPRPLSGAAQP